MSKKIIKRYKLKQDVKDAILFIILFVLMILLIGIVEKATF